MKKFLFYFVLFALCSCTDMNIKVQRIETPTDCVTNEGWSWNDGVAIVTSGSSCKFEFKSKLSGILSFKYAFPDYNSYSRSRLDVSIDGKDCFHEDGYDTDTIQVVLKNISKNSRITFEGYRCMVKDLMISSSLEEDKQDDGSHHDDDWF